MLKPIPVIFFDYERRGVLSKPCIRSSISKLRKMQSIARSSLDASFPFSSYVYSVENERAET